MIAQGETKGFDVRRALPELLDVFDGFVQFPTKTGVQITDSHSRRAADARGAVEINRVAFGEQFVECLNRGAEFGAKLDLFLDHGRAAKNDSARPVVRLQGRKIQIDGAHVVVGVNVEHGGDARLAAEAFDIFNRAGMRADKEIRQDLRVSKFFAGESTHFPLGFQVTTDSCGMPAIVRSMRCKR